MELKQTTEDVMINELGQPYLHKHVVWVNNETAEIVCSDCEGHDHIIQYIPPQEAQQDPQTGQEISPYQPGRYSIQPALDGHTHQDVIEYMTVSDSKTTQDEEVVKEVYELFKNAYEINADSFRDAESCDKYYAGEQWDSQTKSELENLDRAALVINKVEKHVDDICGHYKQNKMDLKFLPKEDGDQRIADVLNEVVKHVTSACDFDREESLAVEDQVIRGVGYFNIYMDFEDDIRGEIKMESYPSKECLLGAHTKPDFSDGEYLVKHKMYSLHQAKYYWPKKAEQLTRCVTSLPIGESNGSTPIDSADFYSGEGQRSFPYIIGTLPMLDITNKDIRVIECERRIYKVAKIAVNQEVDFVQNLIGWEDKDIEAVGRLPGFKIVQKKIKRIRRTKVCGDVLLSDENPVELPYDDFFIVPVYAKYRNGRYWGKVKPARDLQDELNKRRSQMMDIGNKVANYGYYVDSNIFQTEEEKARFKRDCTSPGFVVEVNTIDRIPRKEEGVKFPSELAQLSEMNERGISDQMNIIAEPTGANQSASHLQFMQKMRLVGNEFLTDNQTYAKRKLGRLFIKLLQKYYSVERILRILDHRAIGSNGVEIMGQPYSIQRKEEIRALLENNDLTKYDVVVSQSPNSPTVQMSTQMLLTDLQQAGAQIDPMILIETSYLPDAMKSKIRRMYEAQQQAAAQASQQAGIAEVEKTALAKDIITPQIAQKIGMQQ